MTAVYCAPRAPLRIDQEVRQDFERLVPHIATALEHAGGTHEPEHIWNGILAGQFHLWPGEHSVVVTEILFYPTGKQDLHFFLAGGNLEELEQMYPRILEWGKSVGCSRATLAGRAGWTRSFLTRKEGWKAQWTVCAKEI